MISLADTYTAMLASFFILYASYIGMKLARVFSWVSLRNPGCPSVSTAVGLAFGPYLLGLSAIAALYLFAGCSALKQILVVFGLLLFLHGLLHLFSKSRKTHNRALPMRPEEYFFGVILVLWIVALFFNAFTYPLYENDALEYMTVARQLFHTHSLFSYPMINQEPTASGFYGPWTHPPLYVSLLYFMHLIQGHALSPGIARVIAPWAAVLSTYLVYTLGCVHRRLSGVLAALIFISTPLLFMGAAKASIDSTTVLGFILVFAILVGGCTQLISSNILLGLALGGALWSHSQTILLIPMLAICLLLYFGLRDWTQSLKSLMIIIGTAVLFASWPYLKNYAVFGALISDNPLVFAEPGLKWNEYFMYARGFDNPTAIVQYGIFKGWFSIELLGFSFWLMTAGVLLLFKRLRLRSHYTHIILQGLRSLPASDQVLALALSMLIIYMMGTITSVIIGLDLMIKNERYLLVMLPFVSILGGYAISELILTIKKWIGQSGFKVYCYFLALTIVFLLLILAVYSQAIYVPRKYLGNSLPVLDKVSHKLVTNSERISSRILKNLPSTQLSLRMRSTVPNDDLVLSFRPADMYYSDRKMLSYLDPRLLPTYRDNDPINAAMSLARLGVGYIQEPDCLFPVQYNSVIKSILRNPQLTRLIISNNGCELYQLVKSPANVHLIRDFTPGKLVWSYYKAWNLLLGSVLRDSEKPHFLLQTNHPLNFTRKYPFNHRYYNHILISQNDNAINTDQATDLISIKPGHEYRVDFDLAGEGYVQLYMTEHTKDNQLIKYYDGLSSWLRIGTLVLSKSQNNQTFSKRFIAKGNNATFRIDIMGSAKLWIKQARIYEITSPT